LVNNIIGIQHFATLFHKEPRQRAFAAADASR